MMSGDRSREDTIAAVSSPPGRSPRGLVRLSGPRVGSLLAAMVKEPPDPIPPRHLIRVRLHEPPTPVMLAFFPGPGSYTGEDLAEIQTAGHPVLLERLLRAATEFGARLAEPGEFTFRGFLKGRFDLTQAEGIAATIAATSDGQLAAARHLREGEVGALARSAVEELGEALALTEAGIDFADEEDVVPISPASLEDRLNRLTVRLRSLTERARSWASLEALPRVVLVGPPSSGKSTLINAMLGRSRAVVDATPGTTRDVLSEPLRLNHRGRRVEVMLVDVAGLDAPGTAAGLARQSQAAAHHAIEQADLLVVLHSASAEPGGEEPEASLSRHVGRIDVRSKADLLSSSPSDQTHERQEGGLPVSAVTGEGVDGLKQAIARRVGEHGVSMAGDRLALQPRHEHALHAAADHLRTARALLIPQREARAIAHVELLAGEMRGALDDLARLGGRLTPDEVIGRVFATFCIGK